MDRYIFLDVDGILNGDREYSMLRKALRQAGLIPHKGRIEDLKPENARREYLLALLAPEMMDRLNRIIEATGAKIILSSTWRNPDSIWGFDAETLLREAGMQGDIIGKTPVKMSMDSRGAEIALKIQEMGLAEDQYIILDDDITTRDARKITGHKNRWIRTSAAEGLTERHLQQALEMLGRA